MNVTNREQKKIDTRALLLETAAGLLKSSGIQKISIDQTMDRIGLTRGSFYIYFKTKKEMILEAFKWSVHNSNDNVKKQLERSSTDPNNNLNDFISFYLCVQHRAMVAEGCPIAALARDFSQTDKKMKKEFSKMLDFLFEQRREIIKSDGEPISREKWIAITSSYIGGLILSRASEGTPLSDEILNASKKYINKVGSHDF